MKVVFPTFLPDPEINNMFSDVLVIQMFLKFSGKRHLITSQKGKLLFSFPKSFHNSGNREAEAFPLSTHRFSETYAAALSC
jgi:hypothetical protein